MVISRDPNLAENAVTFGNLPIEKVSKFKYLGTWLTEDWSSDTEIRCRIECASNAFMKFREVLTKTEFDLNLRLRFVRCYIWSVLFYGTESWTMKVASMNRVEAFEMWRYRRMLRIPWTARITN